MEAIGVLAGGVAHDFNNLLTVIQGNSELALMKGGDDESLAKHIAQIQQAAERAANLTGQLLLMSRRQPMEFANVSVNESVRNLLRMLERLIGEDIAVGTELATDLWKIRGDSGNVEQVIMNLAVNARDAMPGGGNLTVSTRNVTLTEDDARKLPDSKPGEFVCLSVDDTGTGMDEATAGRIFEPFFSTKEAGRGTGLGLSVAYGIVKQHEGWINVHSVPGEGTRFDVFFPALLAAVDPDAPEAAPAHGARGGEESAYCWSRTRPACGTSPDWRSAQAATTSPRRQAPKRPSRSLHQETGQVRPRVQRCRTRRQERSRTG